MRLTISLMCYIFKSMHVHFSGIGGTGIGPLALIAKQAGFTVSGSDKQHNNYIDYLQKHGVTDVYIGQTTQAITATHNTNPIDWFVYSSALPKENPQHPELLFVQQNDIKHSKRDEFLNHLLQAKHLKLIAIAGTHGKTTTTAMAVWLCQQIGMPVSYSVGAKLSFGEMGSYDPTSEYFVYECDEYDRNFLSFAPYLSLITGVDWDHADVYPTRDIYEQAFRDFIALSKSTVVWQSDATRLQMQPSDLVTVIQDNDPSIVSLGLAGLVNRRDAWQVVQSVAQLTHQPIGELVGHIQAFPGLSRRFEQLVPGLYSDYAHTPRKIEGAIQLACEIAERNVVVVYEGLHNTRQHFIKDDLLHLFDDVAQLYVVPSYLAREDPTLKILSPRDIINLTSKPQVGVASSLDDELKAAIAQHLASGDLVLALTAGGGGSLDEWLRQQFTR